MALPNSIDPATPLGTDAKKFGDDQIRAFKQFIVDLFGLPTDTDITAVPMAIAADGSIVLNKITAPVLINSAPDAFVTMGLVIDQGDNDDVILALKSTDVSQPATSVFTAGTFGAMGKVVDTAGGLAIYGLSDGASQIPGLLLRGIVPTADTTKTSSSKAAVLVAGSKSDGGTGATIVGAGENVFGVSTGTAVLLFLIDGSGSIRAMPGRSGVTPNTLYSDLVLEKTSGTTAISLLSAANQSGGIVVGDPLNNNIGKLLYQHNGDYWEFFTGAATVVRVEVDKLVLSNPSVGRLQTSSNLFALRMHGTGGFGVSERILVRVGTEDQASILLNGITPESGGNSFNVAGMTINQVTNDDEAFSIWQDNVNHGATGETYNDTYFSISPMGFSGGGARMRGFTSSEVAAQLEGLSVTGDTGKATSANACIQVNSTRLSGTTGTSFITANTNLFCVRNFGLTKFIVDTEGDLHVDGSTSLTTYDDHDDVQLLTAARASLMPDGDFKQRYAQWVEQYAPVLAKAGIITYNEDGHHFVSYKGMSGLIIDTIRQLADRVARLEEQLGYAI